MRTGTFNQYAVWMTGCAGLGVVTAMCGIHPWDVLWWPITLVGNFTMNRYIVTDPCGKPAKPIEIEFKNPLTK